MSELGNKEPNIPDNILQKLKKLLQMQEGAAAIGSQAEAENAALRIQELLAKYNLDPSVLNFKDEEKPGIIHKVFSLADLVQRHESSWVQDFINGIAKFNYCKSITFMGWGKYGPTADEVAIIGKELNVQIVWYTCEQLIHRIRAMAKQRFKEYNRQGGPEKRNTYIRGYLQGAYLGILTKMKRAQDENLETNDQYALMVTSNKVQLKDYVDKTFDNLKSGKSANLASEHGKEKGYEDGKKMNAHRGLENTNVHGTKFLN